MQLEGAARYVGLLLASDFEIFKHNSEFNIYFLFNRPGVAGAVLQSPLSLIG